MKKSFLLWIVSSVLFWHNSYTQKYNFINYNSISGLASNEVRGIFQDKKGALFITTTAGISIFDGYRFKNFDYKDGIKYDYVKNFAEMDNGNMILFGNTGKEAYIFKDNIYKGSFGTPNIVTQYFTDKNNKGFVCTDNGIFQITDTTFQKINLIDDTSRNVIAVYKYVQANDSVAIVLRTYPQNRLDIINLKTRKIIYTIPGFLGFHFLKDSQNRIWVSSDYLGIKMIDQETLLKPDELFKHTPEGLSRLQGAQVNYAVEDKKGNIWVATTGKGLVKVSPDGSCQYISKENGLLSNTIFRLFIDRDDNLWIGTESGLQRMLDTKTLLYDKMSGLPGDEVYDVVQPDSNKIIISTFHHLAIIDVRKNNVKYYPLPFPEEGYIIRFIRTKNNQVWALTPKRIFQIYWEAGDPIRSLSPAFEETFKEFLAMDDGSFMAISNTKILHYTDSKFIPLADSLPTGRTIAMDNNNRIWAGTNKGLYVYQLSGIANEYKLTPLFNGLLFDNTFQIRFLTNDSKGFIWAATRENGLYKLGLKNNQLLIASHFKREGGLSNNNIRHLLLVDDTTIICGTISGIDKIIIHKSGETPAEIMKFGNLPDNSFAVKYSSYTNSILIPWLGGLTVYYEPIRLKDGNAGRNMFTECYVNGKEYPGFFSSDALVFNNSEKNLTFYFSTYTYSSNKCQYFYWLDNGEKENWIEIKNQNYVQFNNLPHGSYTLYIKAIEEGQGKKAFTIKKGFTIKPLWYQTKIFLYTTILAILSLTIYFVRRRINSIRKNAFIKQQIAETEMAALKAQMNPHFMFNCINSIDSFIQTNDKYNATLYLNKFARLIRNVLDSSKQNLITFSKDIETLKLYIELEELRSENKFRTVLKINEDLMNSDYKVPPLIIQPFVENAIIHGLRNKETDDGILSIVISKNDQQIIYTVTDNGVGRTTASQLSGRQGQGKEQSYGIQMSYERVKLFNKEATPSVAITDLYTNQQSAGTKVEVLLNII